MYTVWHHLVYYPFSYSVCIILQIDINIKFAWEIVILCDLINPHDKWYVVKCVWLRTSACDFGTGCYAGTILLYYSYYYLYYLLNLFLCLFNSICVHAGDKVLLVKFARTSHFRFIPVGFTFNNKKITVSVVFDLFYTAKKPWPTVFVWILEIEFQCSALAFLFFIWHLGLADICQRPYNVFLICSIKELAQAFCGMWTCCNRNWQRGRGSHERQVNMTCITVSQTCIHEVAKWNRGYKKKKERKVICIFKQVEKSDYIFKRPINRQRIG